MATVQAEIDGRPVEATIENPSDMLDGSKALAAITRAEIDIQVTTAKAYPRSITKFKNTVDELATLDQPTARSMYYLIPRGGKKIEGPTVRMAEILVYAWENVRAFSRISAIDERMVTAIGVCFDIERNTSASVEVKRGIVDKDGKRFGDDMIRVTCQAALAIAYREAVFKVIPRSLWKSEYENAKLVAAGKGETVSESREAWLVLFEQLGVKRTKVLEMLGRRGQDDITVDDLVTLAGLKTALDDGETTLEEAFPDAKAPKPTTSGTAELNERMRGGRKNGDLGLDS